MEKVIKKIFNRLNYCIYAPAKIILKSKQYRQNQIYKINNKNINRCFEDRIDLSGDDVALLKRITISYKKASQDLIASSEVFRPSNEWLPIYKHNLQDVIKSLDSSDITELDSMYRNFWRESCSTGLLGLPVDMKSCFFGKNKEISFLNKTLYLNDSIHRYNLWKKYLGQRCSDNELVSPLIGNPYGYYIGDLFIKAGADYQHYYATLITDLIGCKESQNVVAEIGGGFGGMAYYLLRDSNNIKYIDFDLPENLALTSYYLLKAFPEKKVLLYGEAGFKKEVLDDYDIILMPSFELDNLPKGYCDLMFNSYSLAEMSPQTISHYIMKTEEIIKESGYFVHVNHTTESIVSARDFPISDNFKLVSEKIAEWNLGRNSNMDEYEFVYKKF